MGHISYQFHIINFISSLLFPSFYLILSNSFHYTNFSVYIYLILFILSLFILFYLILSHFINFTLFILFYFISFYQSSNSLLSISFYKFHFINFILFYQFYHTSEFISRNMMTSSKLSNSNPI